MRKPELVAAIAAKTGESKQSVSESMLVVLDEITNALVKEERVTLPGLGSLVPVSRAARSGVNPKTGEQLQIAASRSVTFKAGKALKDAVNGRG